MRKSTSTRSRVLRAGIATGVIAAAVLATGTPAYAADVEVTLTPTTGPSGGGNTIAVAGTGVFTSITAPGARFIPSTANCPAGTATIGAPTATSVAATVTKTNDNSGTVVVPALGVGTWKLCLLNNTTATAVIAGHGATNYAVTLASPTLSPAAGAGGAATTVTATGAAGNTYIGAATAVGATFSTGACPATYTTTGTNIAATASRTSTSAATITTPTTLTAPNTYNVCIYNGTAGTSTLIGSSTYSALPTVSLSPAVGPSGGTNTITVSSTTNFLAGVASPTTVFSPDACTPYYPQTGSPIASLSVNRITESKVAILVPTGVALTGGATTAPYNVCIYTGTSAADALIAVPATYTIAPALTVTSISPAQGPAQGGSLVTITGNGFPTAADAVVSASVGGSPLTRVRVINGTTITGYTTAHAPGNANVSVTTAAGTKTAAGTPYTYTYGITVSPNTAPANTTPYIDILGAGFSSLTFSNTPLDNDTHVFMVNDRYDPAEDGTVAGTYDNPPVTECTNVVIISDVEIICQLDLANTLNPDGTDNTADPAVGTYTIEVVTDAEPGATLAATATSIISSGSTFTVAPY